MLRPLSSRAFCMACGVQCGGGGGAVWSSASKYLSSVGTVVPSWPAVCSVAVGVVQCGAVQATSIGAMWRSASKYLSSAALQHCPSCMQHGYCARQPGAVSDSDLRCKRHMQCCTLSDCIARNVSSTGSPSQYQAVTCEARSIGGIAHFWTVAGNVSSTGSLAQYLTVTCGARGTCSVAHCQTVLLAM
eukprot:1158441-Pelagomonas_calceolata.AAC.5